MPGRPGPGAALSAGRPGRNSHGQQEDIQKSPVKSNKSVLHRYNNITNTILNNNLSGGDIDELFINSARDGAYDRIQNLLSNGDSSLVSVDLKDRRTGNTALIWAAKRGHVKIAQLLLRHGADSTLRNYDGQSALEVASPVIKQIILDCVESGSISSTQKLLQAAWIGNSDVVNQMLSTSRPVDVDCCNSEGFTPLLLCTRDVYMMEKLGSQLVKNHQPSTVINDLIQCRANTRACDAEGKTALHYCASSKASSALNLAALLVQNSPTDTKDRRSLTPLHYACQAGNSGIVKLLVESGSEVNSRGFAGTTPLHIAAYNNHEQTAMILLEYGADPYTTDDSGQSAIDVARFRKFKTMLRSWKEPAPQKSIELAPVRAPGTPRSRQLSAGTSRAPTILPPTSQLADPSGALQKILTASDEVVTRGIQREGTRLLGAPRGHVRSGSRELLAPLHHQLAASRNERTSAEQNILRSHSTSDIGDSSVGVKRSRLDVSSADRQQRADGVMSVEVLGIGSADKRRRSSADAFYNRAPHHDVMISNHGRGHSPTSPIVRLAPLNNSPHNNQSPVTGGERTTSVYTNLPDIMSPSSPLLSTIHEDLSLPRSVMMESDKLRNTDNNSEKLLQKRNSTPTDDKPTTGDGVGALLKTEFVLDDSRIEEHRTTNNQKPTNNTVNKVATSSHEPISKKSEAANRLKAASQANAAIKNRTTSQEVPNTVASKILTHVVAKEPPPKPLQHSPSKGKITMHHSNLLEESPTGGDVPVQLAQSVTASLALPIGVARQQPMSSKDSATVFKPTLAAPTPIEIPVDSKAAVAKADVNPTAKSQVTKGVTKEMVDRLQNAISANCNATAAKVTTKPPQNSSAKSGSATVAKKPTNLAKPTNLNNTNKFTTSTPNKYTAPPVPKVKSQEKVNKPVTRTSQSRPVAKKQTPTKRESIAVAKINTNMAHSSVHSPRRPDKPLSRQVSYGSRSNSMENFDKTPPTGTTKPSNVVKDAIPNSQPPPAISTQSSSSSDDFTPANEAVVTPRPTPSDTSPKQLTKAISKSAMSASKQTVANSVKSSSANPIIKQEAVIHKTVDKVSENNQNNINYATLKGELPVVRQPAAEGDIKWPPSRENVIKTEVKQPFTNGARAYQPLHMLMNSTMVSTNMQNKFREIAKEEVQAEALDVPTIRKDHALTLTFSQQQEIEQAAQDLTNQIPPLPVEHHGPVIEDIFENFPRPLYEFAVHVAQDLANKKATQTKKKKKKVMPNRSALDSRSSSGVKAKRTKGIQATPADSAGKKRVKSAKKRGGKGKAVSTGTDADYPVVERDNTALISGVGWHITADREADVEYVYNHSDTDGGITTGDDSDGEGLTRSQRRHRRSYDFHDMSPRQRREELKNLLVLMRNTNTASLAGDQNGSATSMLPETMQAIHDFVVAVPNEQELSRLFGLEHNATPGNVNRSIHDISEEKAAISDAEGSIPDVSEIDLNDQMSEDEAPALMPDDGDMPEYVPSSGNDSAPSLPQGNPTDDNVAEDKENLEEKSEQAEDQKIQKNAGAPHKATKVPERCVSTAMTDIIDEILNTPRSKSPYGKCERSPRRRLPDSLVREIHEEWEKASQSTASGSNSTSGSSSQNTSMLSTMTSTEASTMASSMTSTMTGHTQSDSDSESDTSTHDSSESETDLSLSSDTDTEVAIKPQKGGKRPIPRLSAASPAPIVPPADGKKNARLQIREVVNSNRSEIHSTGSKKGVMSFSEVDNLPIAFPLLDEKQLTASLKSEINSRPHSRTVISRLGRRPSIHNDDHHNPPAAGSLLTHRSTASDESHLLTWKKGNILGKGAYGTVYCGLTSDGHLIAVKQIELNVHDWDKAEKEYESIQEEVDLLKTLQHTNIVGFLGTSLDDHVVSIFMQFVPGGTISSLLNRFGAFEERVFQKYTLQIVEGVHYLHENGVIHRDIKGANIMLMSNGIIKLIDFGCAKRLCLHLSVSQSEVLKSMKGTPYWMAPEVIKETGHGYKSDIWSIGCTVFEMATTKPPWSEMQPMAAIFAIGSNKPIPELPETCSEQAREFVNLCLQRDPNVRKSAPELLRSHFLTSMI